ncbi:unnamed protein product [Protopolystoma xenopodis]|uniref:Uncharacterized protein n=1 Tax=Protopolystoma xenopodis TaxID=117903 RepID=A0A448XGB9_9PLAT|nr:unnamed protein product [Protopolystoma xenopodis]
MSGCRILLSILVHPDAIHFSASFCPGCSCPLIGASRLRASTIDPCVGVSQSERIEADVARTGEIFVGNSTGSSPLRENCPLALVHHRLAQLCDALDEAGAVILSPALLSSAQKLQLWGDGLRSWIDHLDRLFSKIGDESIKVLTVSILRISV